MLTSHARTARVLVLALLAALAACGGSGGGGPGPSIGIDADILFPPEFVVSATDQASIRVRGTLRTTGGSATDVRVNGVTASTTDGWDNWQATIPLAVGLTTIRVAVETPYGTASSAASTVISRFADPLTIAVGGGDDFLLGAPSTDTALRYPIYDPVTRAVYLVAPNRRIGSDDDAILQVALAGGERQLFYDPAGAPGAGTGEPLLRARSLAWATGDGVFLADLDLDAVIEITSLTTGGGQIVSDGAAGPALSVPTGAVLAPGGTEVLVTNGDTATPVLSLVAVDLATGNRTVISDAGTGTGPNFTEPTALSRGAAADEVYVGDGHTGRVLRVVRSTGNRTLVSGSGTGTGPDLDRILDLHYDGSRNRLLGTEEGGRLFAVALPSGNRTLLTGPAIGAGPPVFARGVALLDEGDDLAVVASTDALHYVDLLTGERVVVSR